MQLASATSKTTNERVATPESEPQEPPKLEPSTPEFVLTHHRKHLTRFERNEILEFTHVFYFGPHAKKVEADARLANNCGFDTGKGRYRCMRNDHIGYRYQIVGELGQGAFGDVVDAIDHKTKRKVAIKIARNDPLVSKQAVTEAKFLKYLKKHDKNNSRNIVHIEEVFGFRGHVCVVFERLQEDLFTALESSDFRGFQLPDIRSVTSDVLTALALLSELSFVHCDLKPENIVFCDHDSLRVKLIDFGGSSCSKGMLKGETQSLYYRAPEVILGCGFHAPIDMWSLGCIVAELHTGHPLFAGRTAQEQLALQIEVLGLPPAHMMAAGRETRRYFDSNNELIDSLDRNGRVCGVCTNPLEQVLGTDATPELLSFVKGCLEWDPEVRMTPQQAMCHPFVVRPQSANADVAEGPRKEEAEALASSTSMTELPSAQACSLAPDPTVMQPEATATATATKEEGVEQASYSESAMALSLQPPCLSPITAHMLVSDETATDALQSKDPATSNTVEASFVTSDV